MATNSLGLTVDVSSSTKDSISVRWRLEGPGGGPGGSSSVQRASVVQGFEVRYQAIGSTIVQQSHRLDASASAYDIVQLHENTYYDICVKAFTSLNASSSSSSGSPSVPSIQAASGQASSSSSSSVASSHTDACIKGTTATDSLWVALGSTFGAFLALGFIVFLVFLAKWQHSRNERKQKLMTSAYDDARVQQLRECDDDDDDDDDDYDPKGSSSGVHLPDDLAMSELSGHSSELSIALYADDHLTANDDDDDDDDDDDQRLQDRRHQHGWIAATPYEAAEGEREDEDGDRRRSIDDDDSGIQKELLRPPPIPGIILRPVQSTADRPGSDQIRPKSSSSSDRRLGSTERGSGDANNGRRQDEDEEGNAASASSDASTGHGIVACHPPLKPTASNLW